MARKRRFRKWCAGYGRVRKQEAGAQEQAKLDPSTFLRIHRSTIVNIERIRELQQHFNGDYIVVLQDGTELKLSRSRREQLEKLLKSGRL